MLLFDFLVALRCYQLGRGDDSSPVTSSTLVDDCATNYGFDNSIHYSLINIEELDRLDNSLIGSAEIGSVNTNPENANWRFLFRLYDVEK